MRAIGQFFSVVLFIMLCKLILAFESVDEIPKFEYFPMMLFILRRKRRISLRRLWWWAKWFLVSTFENVK